MTATEEDAASRAGTEGSAGAGVAGGSLPAATTEEGIA